MAVGIDRENKITTLYNFVTTLIKRYMEEIIPGTEKKEAFLNIPKNITDVSCDRMVSSDEIRLIVEAAFSSAGSPLGDEMPIFAGSYFTISEF